MTMDIVIQILALVGALFLGYKIVTITIKTIVKAYELAKSKKEAEESEKKPKSKFRMPKVIDDPTLPMPVSKEGTMQYYKELSGIILHVYKEKAYPIADIMKTYKTTKGTIEKHMPDKILEEWRELCESRRPGAKYKNNEE